MISLLAELKSRVHYTKGKMRPRIGISSELTCRAPQLVQNTARPADVPRTNHHYFMRWTQGFIPTLKETPAEAEILSHKLLLRAGLIRKLTGGLYTFLPLGLRALRKVERIVREEMDRAGALEVLMPALQPPEIWEQSGRYATAQGV